MSSKKGFLLLESIICLTLLLLAIVSVAYHQAVVARCQRSAIKRFQAINMTRALLDKIIEDVHYLCPTEKDGFTFLIEKKPINLITRDIIDSLSEHVYYYTALQITVSWYAIDNKKESLSVSSGVWHK